MSDDLRASIGRTEQAVGVATEELVNRLRQTLSVGETPADQAPLGIHWCLALTSVGQAALGVDGHPAKGLFLPEIPLPNRMWAAGELTFHDALCIGDIVDRCSAIADIRFKEGRSGPLCFVSIDHRYSTERGPAITERQNIVYRNPALDQKKSAPDAEINVPGQRIVPDPALLFRYSALTFNSHRIHYDRDYAVTEEGYPERVVHGPLQATLLMNLATARRGMPLNFAFRALRPAFVNRPLWLDASDDGDAMRLQSRDGSGEPCMEASAIWLTAR